MAEAQREEIDIVVRTDGLDDGKRKTDSFATALDKLDAAHGRQVASSDKASAAAARAAQAKASAEASAARYQAQIDRENRALALLEQAQNAAAEAAGGLTAAQQRAAQSAAAIEKAANDNSAALNRQLSAYEEAGKAALHHPILAAAGASLAAKALSGLATSAGTSLATASTAASRFGAENAAMGPAVATAAALAARGLATASTAATAAGGTFGTAAEKVGSMTSATALLTRGLAAVPPAAIPIAAALAVFLAGALAIEKANSDLDRLIQLGERAKSLNIAAPFVKSFESLGPAIHASADEMDIALKRAAGFVKDQFNQENALGKMFRDISSTGVARASGLKAETQLDLAGNTQERIQAALAGMKELEELGLHVAALKIGEAVFGPEVIERLRVSNVSISEFADRAEAAAQKEVLKQEQVDRAVNLSRAIADTKEGISAALAVTFDFSAAGLLLNEAWLKILQAVRWIVEAINSGIEAVTAFGAAVLSSIGGAFDKVTAQATALLGTLGIIAKQQATEVQGPPEAAGPPEEKITARQFPYVFGPEAPKAAAAAAKQSQQAAQEAVSAYDNLIQRTKDRIDELDLETRSVGQTNEAVIKLKLAHDLERAAQKSGIDVTGAMRAEWDRLGISLAASTEALAQAKRGIELTKEAQRELGDEFSTFADDVILQGKKIEEAFAGIAKTFASSSLKALLTGQGSLAGLFGTAGEKSGDLGGLLGGRLGNLFGGDNAAGSPLPGAQGPSVPESNLLSSIFSARQLRDAVAGGTADGNSSFWDGLFKQRQSAQGVPQGFFSSPIGGAIGAAGAGGAIGYSSASPIAGALGGELAGFSITNDDDHREEAA